MQRVVDPAMPCLRERAELYSSIDNDSPSVCLQSAACLCLATATCFDGVTLLHEVKAQAQQTCMRVAQGPKCMTVSQRRSMDD